MRPVLALALVLAASASLSAEDSCPKCSSCGMALSVMRAGSPKIATQDVSMTSSLQFVAMDVTIAVGDSVRWTNNASVIHTTTSDTGIWDSNNIAAGGTFTQAFPAAGTFPYHCTIHGSPGAGMHGTITVLDTPVISSPATATGTVNSPFRFAILASQSPTSYTITGLPAGLSQDPTNTNIISGTPTASGTFPVSVTATNDAGLSSATQTLTITIDAAVGGAPVISSATAAAAAVNTAFSYTITAAPTATLPYSATGLPTGLNLDTTTGAITGAVSTPSVFDVTIAASNGAGADTTQIVVTITPAASTTGTASAGSASGGSSTAGTTTGYGSSGGGHCGMSGGATALSLALAIGWVRRRARGVR